MQNNQFICQFIAHSIEGARRASSHHRPHMHCTYLTLINRSPLSSKIPSVDQSLVRRNPLRLRLPTGTAFDHVQWQSAIHNSPSNSIALSRWRNFNSHYCPTLHNVRKVFFSRPHNSAFTRNNTAIDPARRTNLCSRT